MSKVQHLFSSMVYSNAERQRLFRERKKATGQYEEFKSKEAERLRRLRKAKKEEEKNMTIYKQRSLLEARREQVRKRVMKHRMRKQETFNSPLKKSPFKSAMAYAKAAQRVKRALPETPRRSKIICKKLYQMYEKSTSYSPADSGMTSRSTALGTETVNIVRDFYQRDDISRQAPGRKDVVTILNENGEKQQVQVRHLTSSVMETYRLFQKDFPNINIGKSKFAELRPKHVFLSSKLPHNVCLCKYHENVINAINALHKANPDIPAYSQTFPESLICDPPTEECWLNKCDKCKNGTGFSAKYTEELQSNTSAQWAIWKNDKDKLIKVVEDGTVKELTDHIISLIPQFLEHCYIKRKQSATYQKERLNAEPKSENYNPSHALIQVDFSENYTCVSQDEIQSESSQSFYSGDMAFGLLKVVRFCFR